MASLGDSFLNMAEAMLGKHNRSSSFEALAAVGELADASTPDLKPINSDNTDASTSSSSNNSDSQNDRQTNTSDKMDERENIFVITPPKRRRRMTGNYPTIDAIHRLNTAMSRVSPRSDIGFDYLLYLIRLSVTHPQFLVSANTSPFSPSSIHDRFSE